MKYGFSTGFASAPQFSIDSVIIEPIAKAGFDYVEFPLYSLIPMTDEPLHDLKIMVKEYGLTTPVACNFFPANLTLALSPMDEIQNYLNKAFFIAKFFEMKKLVFGSGSFRKAPEGISSQKWRDTLKDFVVKHMLPLANFYQIPILMECLNYSECNVLTTTKEGLAFIKEIDEENVRLAIDTYHMEASSEDLSILDEASPYIRHVHVAERNRMLPMESFSLYQTQALSRIKAIGYDDTISSIAIQCLCLMA